MHKKTFLICSLTLLPVVVAAPLILTSCGGKYISKHFSYNDVPYANDPIQPNEEFNKLTTPDKINYLNKNINDNSVSLKSGHSQIKDYVGNITASYNNGYGGIDLRFEFKDKKDISILFPNSDIAKEYTKVDCINLRTESEFNIVNISKETNQNFYTLQTRDTSRYFVFKVYYEKTDNKRSSDEYDLSSLDVKTRDYQNYEF